MKDEKNNISAGQVYGMFEEVKEMIEKRPAPDASVGTATKDDTVILKLDENKSAIDRSVEQVAALTNRIGQIDFRPVVKIQPPDMTDVKRLCQYIDSHLNQLNDKQQEVEDKMDKLQAQIAQMQTEVDTTEFKQLSDNTIYEMKQQIRYLKQPPIVLKVIIGIAVVALITTLAAGYYFRDSREWKESSQYWYEQSLQKPQPKTDKKAK